MAGTPIFVQRVARIPQVIALLSSYPEGLSVRELAAHFDTTPETLIDDIKAFLDLDTWGWQRDIFTKQVIEFVQPDGDDDDDVAFPDPDASTFVRVLRDQAVLGVEHLNAGDLGVIYTAGAALLETEPDNEHLASALEVIAETMYGEPTAAPEVARWNKHLAPLQKARDEQHQVKIVYSRMWSEGVSERVIEPLHLIQTRRGWEVDAGPVGPEGNLRTFLLSNIRTLEVLDTTFEPPQWVDSLLAKQRATTDVQVRLTQEGRWAAKQYAEKVTVLTEDEEQVDLELDLLPPVAERIGLIMLANGPTTQVLSRGSEVLPGAFGVAEKLLEHHRTHP